MGKGQASFDLGDARPAAWPRLATARVSVHWGVYISDGDAPAKLSRHALAAVGHGIGFAETGTARVPVLGADRDLTAQRRARTRSPKAFIAALGHAGI
jgi:hypothetical protein